MMSRRGTGCVACGQNSPRYTTSRLTLAALAVRRLSSNSQATWIPVSRPNAQRRYRYVPPVAENCDATSA